LHISVGDELLKPDNGNRAGAMARLTSPLPKVVEMKTYKNPRQKTAKRCAFRLRGI
jgi:hypothetical protein